MREIRAWDDVLGKMLYSKFKQYDDSIGYRFEQHFETETPVYMWGTGRKDGKGKSIYEGDLCDDGNGTIAPIEWVQDSCQFLWMYEGDVQEIGEWCIVVGNRFEHPELLEREGRG